MLFFPPPNNVSWKVIGGLEDEVPDSLSIRSWKQARGLSLGRQGGAHSRGPRPCPQHGSPIYPIVGSQSAETNFWAIGGPSKPRVNSSTHSSHTRILLAHVPESLSLWVAVTGPRTRDKKIKGKDEETLRAGAGGLPRTAEGQCRPCPSTLHITFLHSERRAGLRGTGKDRSPCSTTS